MRSGMAEEIFDEAFAAFGVVGGDGLFVAVVDIEAGVFPGEEVGEFAGADEFGIAQGMEEAVAEEIPALFLLRSRPCSSPSSNKATRYLRATGLVYWPTRETPSPITNFDINNL